MKSIHRGGVEWRSAMASLVPFDDKLLSVADPA
jgi:hypothetical protein